MRSNERAGLNFTQVEGVRLIAEGVVGATGLEIKSDPGVPFVYAGRLLSCIGHWADLIACAHGCGAGFGGLMVTTLVSYLSHSQVWALQEGGYVFVAGRSNRDRLGFEKEMNQTLEAVPEL